MRIYADPKDRRQKPPIFTRTAPKKWEIEEPATTGVIPIPRIDVGYKGVWKLILTQPGAAQDQGDQEMSDYFGKRHTVADFLCMY
jgi:hypothetical protein